MARKARTTGSVKQRVLELLDQLPDDCTIEDVQYQLYLLEKINRSEEAIRRGDVISHDEVRRRVASWRR
jgi:hypothetical protein